MDQVIGYLVYLLTVFIPGIGICEICDAYDVDEIFSERVARAFCTGLCFSTILLTISTSGLYFLGEKLSGISYYLVYIDIVFGLVLTLISLALRRKIKFMTMPNLADFVIFLIVAIVAGTFYLQFLKYPIFPSYNSYDFRAHVSLAESLLSGSSYSIPSGIFYDGMDMQIALALLLVNGINLVISRTVMAIFVSISPFVFYFATSKIFLSKKVSIISTAIYSLAGYIWVGSVLNSGLYANFFGIIISLFFLSIFVSLTEKSISLKGVLLFSLSVFGLYMSHYTAVTLLFSVFLYPFFVLLLRRKNLVLSSFYSAISIIPSALALAVRPNLVSLLLTLAVAGGGSVVGSTYFSSLLSSLPVFSYMALEVYGDASFFLLLLFFFVSFYFILRRKIYRALIPLVWFVSLLFAAPFNISAWRFSFEALVPLTILSSYGIASIIPERSIAVKKVAKRKFI